jgi:hypothetical protein
VLDPSPGTDRPTGGVPGRPGSARRQCHIVRETGLDRLQQEWAATKLLLHHHAADAATVTIRLCRDHGPVYQSVRPGTERVPRLTAKGSATRGGPATTRKRVDRPDDRNDRDHDRDRPSSRRLARKEAAIDFSSTRSPSCSTSHLF